MKKLFVGFIALTLLYTANAQFTVGVKTLSFTDPARSNRSVGVDFRFPGTNTAVAAGQFPFVIFGHGFSMGADAYYNYGDTLAKQGYIVALLTTETGLGPNHTNFANDLIFIYNKLIAENANTTSFFYQKVVPKGAIGGHSMGAGCTVLSTQFSNPAVCYFTFAAATTNPSSITAAPSMTKPYLAFAGSRDCIAPYATNQLPHYTGSGAPCKFMVNIKDALHCQFNLANTACSFGEGSSGCASSPLTRGAQFSKVMFYLVPFLNYYLKGDCSAWDVFEDRYATNTVDSLIRSCTNIVPSNASISGITNPCNGASTTLTAAPSGFQYQWNDNSTQSTLQTSTNGTYSVLVGNGTCQLPAVSATVTQQFSPSTPTSITGGSSVCLNSSNSFSVASVSGASSYNWTLPNGWSISNGQGTNLITVQTNSTSGTITVNAQNNCGNSGDASLNVNIIDVPTQPAITGNDTACSNASQNFSATGSSQNSFTWTLPTGSSILSGSGTNTISAVINTSGTINVTETNQCGTSVVGTLNVTVLDTPQITVVQSGSTLTYQPNTFLQSTWYDNSGNVVGIGNDFEPSASGVYYVRVTDENGCTASSNSINYIFTSLENVLLNATIQPNPASNFVVINFAITPTEETTIEVISMEGKIVSHQTTQNRTAFISLENISMGLYLVEIRNNTSTVRKKIIVE
jgi:hypothetical protein